MNTPFKKQEIREELPLEPWMTIPFGTDALI